MRDTMIFYRNSPSIFFWEAGNTIVTPEQMTQMVEMRKTLDPHGGRDIEGRLAGDEPVEEPERLLRERQRQFAVARDRFDRIVIGPAGG